MPKWRKSRRSQPSDRRLFRQPQLKAQPGFRDLGLGEFGLRPRRSTRCISRKARTGSEKFLNAARQTTKTKLSFANGMAEALPRRKSTVTPSRWAFWRERRWNALLDGFTEAELRAVLKFFTSTNAVPLAAYRK
jgi:hypothetical protein